MVEPQGWSVFDRKGRWTTDVIIPLRLEIIEIGADNVLAVWHDDLGIPYLRRHDLLKPAEG